MAFSNTFNIDFQDENTLRLFKETYIINEEFNYNAISIEEWTDMTYNTFCNWRSSNTAIWTKYKIQWKSIEIIFDTNSWWSEYWIYRLIELYPYSNIRFWYINKKWMVGWILIWEKWVVRTNTNYSKESFLDWFYPNTQSLIRDSLEMCDLFIKDWNTLLLWLNVLQDTNFSLWDFDIEISNFTKNNRKIITDFFTQKITNNEWCYTYIALISLDINSLWVKPSIAYNMLIWLRNNWKWFSEWIIERTIET